MPDGLRAYIDTLSEIRRHNTNWRTGRQESICEDASDHYAQITWYKNGSLRYQIIYTHGDPEE